MPNELLNSVTSDLVKASLDASLLRQRIISNNIANANVKGYVPLKVEFESILKKELAADISTINDKQLTDVLESTSPVIQDNVSSNAAYNTSSSNIDLEMAEMAKNSIRYEALINGLSKMTSLNGMAIRGGRN